MTDGPTSSDTPAATEVADAPAPLFDMLDLDSAADEAEPDLELTRSGYTVTLTVADDSNVSGHSLCEAALSVLVEENAPKGQLDIHLVDTDTVRDLNHTHMHSDEPTDVLAFPLDPEDDGISSAAGSVALLGDVVICPAVAFAQAPGHTGSFEAEMLLLTIHGTLHVLGHDHGETEERLVMQGRERHHLASLDVVHPVPAP